MSCKAKLQVTLVVEVAVDGKHTLHHGGECRAHATVAQAFGQSVLPSRHGECLECAHTIYYRASYGRICALGRDETLNDFVVSVHALYCEVERNGCGEVVLLAYLHHLNHHRVHGISVVVVHGKLRTVAIPSVAQIPLAHLAQSYGHYVSVIFLAYAHEESLNHAAEEQPVVVGRAYCAQTLESVDVALLGYVVELAPCCLGSAHEALHEIRSVAQRLCHVAEPGDMVGIVWVYRILVCLYSPCVQLLALRSLRSAVVGQRYPRTDARHESGESLKISHTCVATVPLGAQFEREVLLEIALAHIFKHRTGYLVA